MQILKSIISLLSVLKADSVLKRYKKEDFIVQLKVRFLYYLILGFIVSMLLIIPLTAFIQLEFNPLHAINFEVVLTELILTVVFFLCLFLVVTGKFKIISHVLLIFSFSTVWIVMNLDYSQILTKFDTVVYVLVILAIAPTIITGKKNIILLYTLGNLLMLGVFIFLFLRNYYGDRSQVVDYLLDTIMSIGFLGLVAYNNYTIHKAALDKAQVDINARQEAERLLSLSEKKYREMTEFLPQAIFESDLSGKLTYLNKYGFEKYGFSLEELINKYDILDFLDSSEVQKAKERIERLFQTGIPNTDQYTVARKDGTKFPVQITTSLILEDGKPIGIRGITIDISEIKETEKQLQESRNQYQSLIENIPGITYRCLMDEKWTMLFISSEIDKLTGYSATDFINNDVRTFESIIYPDDTIYVTTVVEKAVTLHLPWELEYRVLHRDGSVHWVYEKGRAIFDSKGNIQHLDGFILDITSRKTAELALTISEERFKHLFMTAPVGLSTIDLSGKISLVNRVLTEVLGYTVEDIPTIADWWIKAYPDENYRKEVLDGWNSRIGIAIANKTIVDPAEYRVTDKWGKIHHMIIGASVHSDYILASFIDISERKHAEDSLLESEERFRAMIELLPYSIIVVNLEGKLVIINEAFCKELGYSKEEAIGKSPEELDYIIDPDSMREVWDQLQEKGVVENFETTVTKKDNSIIYVYFSCRLLNFNGQPVILGSSINITEKKKIEQELEDYRKNLEVLVMERTEDLAVANEELMATNQEYQAINEELYEKNKIIFDQNVELNQTLQHLKDTQTQLVHSEKMASLGILTAGVAHEINNPLNFIMGGYVGLTQYLDDYNLTNDDTNFMLESIKTGVDRASAIVGSLNQFSRNNETLDENCDIHAIIDNCLVMLDNSIKNRIEVTRNYIEQPVTIVGNVGKMHQVFLNILNNAVQAIENEGTIKISSLLAEGNVCVEISDTGHGISEENLLKITDPFFTTKEAGEGTGLGLSITYNIIKEHSGKLEFKSGRNQGTTVLINLPLKK